MPTLHFHDLRHTGNTLAAQTGASLRDLMARMGHDGSRAAMICQHATAQADLQIADAMSAKIEAATKQTRKATSKVAKKQRRNGGDRSGRAR